MHYAEMPAWGTDTSSRCMWAVAYSSASQTEVSCFTCGAAPGPRAVHQDTTQHASQYAHGAVTTSGASVQRTTCEPQCHAARQLPHLTVGA